MKRLFGVMLTTVVLFFLYTSGAQSFDTLWFQLPETGIQYLISLLFLIGVAGSSYMVITQYDKLSIYEKFYGTAGYVTILALFASMLTLLFPRIENLFMNSPTYSDSLLGFFGSSFYNFLMQGSAFLLFVGGILALYLGFKKIRGQKVVDDEAKRISIRSSAGVVLGVGGIWTIVAFVSGGLALSYSCDSKRSIEGNTMKLESCMTFAEVFHMIGDHRYGGDIATLAPSLEASYAKTSPEHGSADQDGSPMNTYDVYINDLISDPYHTAEFTEFLMDEVGQNMYGSSCGDEVETIHEEIADLKQELSFVKRIQMSKQERKHRLAIYEESKEELRSYYADNTCYYAPSSYLFTLYSKISPDDEYQVAGTLYYGFDVIDTIDYLPDHRFGTPKFVTIMEIDDDFYTASMSK